MPLHLPKQNGVPILEGLKGAKGGDRERREGGRQRKRESEREGGAEKERWEEGEEKEIKSSSVRICSLQLQILFGDQGGRREGKLAPQSVFPLQFAQVLNLPP